MKPANRSALAMLLLGGVVAWGASENHRESLRGLTGVEVRVERLSDAARSGGLEEKSLAADAEQRLRTAGIRVLAAGQASQEPGAPVLYIRVNVKVSYDAPVFAAGVTVALLQDLVAARNPGLRLREAKTWDAGYMRTYDQAGLRQARGVVNGLVDEFIKDFRETNAKK